MGKVHCGETLCVLVGRCGEYTHILTNDTLWGKCVRPSWCRGKNFVSPQCKFYFPTVQFWGFLGDTAPAPQRRKDLPETHVYRHAKFHADRWHRRRDMYIGHYQARQAAYFSVSSYCFFIRRRYKLPGSCAIDIRSSPQPLAVARCIRTAVLAGRTSSLLYIHT